MGVGIRVPIAVLSMLVLRLLPLRERGRRKHAEKASGDLGAVKDLSDRSQEPGGGSSSEEEHRLHGSPPPQEMSAVISLPGELHSRQMHEVGYAS